MVSEGRGEWGRETSVFVSKNKCLVFSLGSVASSYTVNGSNCVHFIFTPFSIGVCCKRKEFAAVT